MSHRQEDNNVDGTLLPPSPSFMTHSFEVPAVPSSPPSSSRRDSSAWPISYEVHTVGRYSRTIKPGPLVLPGASASSNDGSRVGTPPGGVANPFAGGSQPSTPGASVRSFASSSSSASNPTPGPPNVGLPPVPLSPPPIPRRPVDLDLYSTSPPANVESPTSASFPPTPTRAHTHTNSSSVPPVDARTVTAPSIVHRRARSRSGRERAFKTSSTVNLTPPTTAGSRPSTGTAAGERNPNRDTFSSPPVITTALPGIRTSTVTTGESTPSTRPGSSKAPGQWRLPSMSMVSDGAGDQTYTIDFSGVTDTLKAMQLNGRDERYASASYSSISIPFSGSTGDDKDLALRPSQLLQGKVHKPWLEKRDWRVKASWWITVLTALAGVGASIAVCILGYRSVPMIESNLCPVLDDDFNTFDTVNTWHQEVDMSGYGNGEFEMTTNSPNNSYVKDGMLYILPTLTSDVIGVANVFDAFTYNVTGCTNINSSNGCGAVSNATAGTVINPVMSARITTQFSVNITYGKVEIRAKLPKGDWLWPALWMLPVDNVYGPWPMSGEIDLVEARGNPTSYPFEPINWIRSTLNWGPTISLNRAFKTFGLWNNRRGNFGNEFHVYTMEWTDTFLRIYMDNRLEKTLDVRFNTPFFARGDFPAQVTNKTETIPLENPWAGRGNAAPFDQKFFLIMNVAVGGTNGWFPDNIGGKPWLDGSQTAMRDFALAQDQWYPTWPADPEDRAMVVDYVKMWQTC